MSTLLKQICRLYARQVELHMETGTRWLSALEIAELGRIETDLAKLWKQRQYELAGASEAQRLKADLAMRHGNQGVRTDLIELEVAA